MNTNLFTDNFSKFNFYDYFCFNILGNKINNENIFNSIYNSLVLNFVNFKEIFSYDLFISLLSNIEKFIIENNNAYISLNSY